MTSLVGHSVLSLDVKECLNLCALTRMKQLLQTEEMSTCIQMNADWRFTDLPMLGCLTFLSHKQCSNIISISLPAVHLSMSYSKTVDSLTTKFMMVHQVIFF